MSLSTKQVEKLEMALIAGIPAVERTGIEVLDLEVAYMKMSMPFEPDINHVGMMYAGSLF